MPTLESVLAAQQLSAVDARLVPMSIRAAADRVTVAGVRAGDFALFHDWCTATQLSLAAVSAEDLLAFTVFTGGTSATRKRRLRNIIGWLAADGINIPVPARDVPTVWRSGPGWLPVEDVIERCPVVGWPDGLAGRRDAFLAVLVGQLGRSRRQIRGLTPGQVVVDEGRVEVAGQHVPAGEGPGRCPACAVTRWLRVLSMCDFGRGEVREFLTRAKLRDHLARHDHAAPMADRRWEGMWYLLPAIDQYGWIDAAQPNLSTRSISRIVQARQQDTGPVDDAVDDVDEVVEREPGVYAELDWDELDARLDEICAQADAVLTRADETF